MAEITSLSQLDLSKSYTYQDYLNWRFKERVELIKGRIFKMSPAPNRKHQGVSRNLLVHISIHLKGEICQVYDAPFDVVLTKEGMNTVVQPDICVICDLNKLTEQGCTGAPDLIIEILSPGNSRKEKKEKFELYEENGVKEYWLVSPNENTVIIYNLNSKGKYIGSKPYVEGEEAASSVIDGYSISIEDIFQD